jgi:hypothetical protein
MRLTALATTLLLAAAGQGYALSVDQIVGDWQVDTEASMPGIKASMEKELAGKSPEEKQMAEAMMPMIVGMMGQMRVTVAKDSLTMTGPGGPGGQPKTETAKITKFASTGDATADVTTTETKDGKDEVKTVQVSLAADGKVTITGEDMPPLVFAKAKPAAAPAAPKPAAPKKP